MNGSPAVVVCNCARLFVWCMCSKCYGHHEGLVSNMPHCMEVTVTTIGLGSLHMTKQWHCSPSWFPIHPIIATGGISIRNDSLPLHVPSSLFLCGSTKVIDHGPLDWACLSAILNHSYWITVVPLILHKHPLCSHVSAQDFKNDNDSVANQIYLAAD